MTAAICERSQRLWTATDYILQIKKKTISWLELHKETNGFIEGDLRLIPANRSPVVIHAIFVSMVGNYVQLAHRLSKNRPVNIKHIYYKKLFTKTRKLCEPIFFVVALPVPIVTQETRLNNDPTAIIVVDVAEERFWVSFCFQWQLKLLATSSSWFEKCQHRPDFDLNTQIKTNKSQSIWSPMKLNDW